MNPRLPDPAVKVAVGGKPGARWLLAVLTLLALTATASLGAWQLRRASTKEAAAAQMQERSMLPALTDLAQAAPKNGAANTLPDAAAQALIHRRVQLRGSWLAAHTVFLENRYMAGRAGFFVVTPFQLESGAGVLWVQRGWVPRDPQDRTRLPLLPSPVGTTTLHGRVVQGISQVYALSQPGSAPAAAGVSRIWQNLPTVDLGGQARWLPVAVLQTAPSDSSEAANGLLRDWPAVDSGVAKHYGYAFQWFALCGLIMVLYVWFQILSPRRRRA